MALDAMKSALVRTPPWPIETTARRRGATSRREPDVSTPRWRHSSIEVGAGRPPSACLVYLFLQVVEEPPTTAEIARRTGACEGTVASRLNDLVSAGHVERVVGPDLDPSRSCYRLMSPRGASDADDDPPGQGQGATVPRHPTEADVEA